jgi:RNA polymerase sigma-70 factor (ECF subfamily)
MEVVTIYSQFSTALLQYIRSKIRSKEDAEDILQNIFTKISANVNSINGKDSIKNWLFTVTRNAIIDYYRTNKNSKQQSIEHLQAELSSADDDGDPAKGLDQCLHNMIAQLPDEYRNIITDSELNNIRQKDLAEKYNMAYPSLRSRVQRGRERLKQLLYNCCHIETDKRGNILDVQSKNSCGSCSPCADQS